jgi:endonuclease/exonuclease/phosphatase family metal-dependent hydrolase
MIYSKCSTPKDYGWVADGFAAKGALHARIRRGRDAPDGDSIDVFVTHLESKDARVREFQYEEFAGFIAKHAASDRPALLMGDFNTRGNPPAQRDPESKYHLLLSVLRKARPTVVDLWPTLHGNAIGGTSIQETPDSGRRIDYIFLSNPSTSGSKLTPLDVRVNGFLDPRVGALSDHSAVEADLRWDRPE